MSIGWKTKKTLALVLCAATSATIAAFLFFLPPQWHGSFIQNSGTQYSSWSDNISFGSSSIELRLKSTSPTPGVVSQATSSGFRGPVGKPHIIGPTNPPPKY